MSNRKLLILSAIFLALFLFVVVYERHQPNSEEAAKAKKRLVDFKPEESPMRPEAVEIMRQRAAASNPAEVAVTWSR